MMSRQRFALAAVVAGLALSSSAFAADGTITFTGAITDTTCAVSVGGTGNANATITLPTVQTTSLPAVGATAGTTPFDIVLSGCTGGTLNTASTHFESGSTVDSATGRLHNTSGSASGVQLQLLNASHGSIVAGGASQNDVPVSITSGTGTLSYYVQYYANAGAVTSGSVGSYVDYSISYQ